MRPRPTKEQFSPHAHAYDVRGCKGNPSSRHAALTCYAVTSAQVSGELYGYDYDNIGNRRLMFGGADYAVYTANELNQYTRISTDGENFMPEYDADGNQTLVQTSTGIWRVTYNAQNRAVKFESTDGSTIITCAYDYMGRRFEKQVVTNGTITTHQRFIYRNYLQIAAVNLKANAPTPDQWFLIWDPTQPVATRPLAIRKDGTWYTYGWDLTKNVCEIYGQQGYIRTMYRYTPYGTVTAEGDISQPIQWSSEFNDSDLGLVYYNYRYYNPTDGRWTRRDPIGNRGGVNLYVYTKNAAHWQVDLLGIAPQEPLQAYWDRWIEARKAQLTENQQQWARKQLARGCVGITVIELGRNPQFMNCSNSLQIAKNIQNSLIKDKSCGGKCPVIYSVHFSEINKGDIAKFNTDGMLITQMNFSLIARNWAYPGTVNFDFGLCHNDMIEHADMYDNPDNDKDGIGDYFPDLPVRNALHFTSTIEKWSEGAPNYYMYGNFNAEIWCVECPNGNYGA